MNFFEFRNIKREYKVAFFSAFLIGLITHLYMITNGFINSDALFSFYTKQNRITSGRWFLQYACGISSYYNLPVVNGFLTLFYLAVAAVLFVYLFDMKHSVFIVLMSGLFVTFPVIASTFSYNFTVDGYMLAVVLAALAVCLFKRYKYGYLAGAICIAFSMGVYQAYIAIVILLCIIFLLLAVLDGMSGKEWILKAAKLLLMGIAGYILCYPSNRIKYTGKTIVKLSGN